MNANNMAWVQHVLSISVVAQQPAGVQEDVARRVRALLSSIAWPARTP